MKKGVNGTLNTQIQIPCTYRLVSLTYCLVYQTTSVGQKALKTLGFSRQRGLIVLIGWGVRV